MNRILTVVQALSKHRYLLLQQSLNLVGSINQRPHDQVETHEGTNAFILGIASGLTKSSRGAIAETDYASDQQSSGLPFD
jgi:hypothetical protein